MKARDEEEKEQAVKVMMVMKVVEKRKGSWEAFCASPPSSRKSGRCVRLFSLPLSLFSLLLSPIPSGRVSGSVSCLSNSPVVTIKAKEDHLRPITSTAKNSVMN